MRNTLSLLAFLLLTPLVFVSCADEQEDEYADDDLEIIAAARWKCGRTVVGRAGTDPIAIDEGDYPRILHITVGDGASKQRPASHPETYAVARTVSEDDNAGFAAYHDQYRIGNLKFDASGLHAVLDAEHSSKESRSVFSKGVLTGLRVEANTLSPRYNGTDGNIPQAWDNTDIPTIGTRDHLTTKEPFGGSTRIDGNHLFLTLGHVMAMLRLHFAVSTEYDHLRYIDLTSVSIEGTPVMTGEHFVLATTPSFICSTYIKPASNNNGSAITTIPSVPLGMTPSTWTGAIGTTTPLTFRCTYDIYDKDAGFTHGKAPTTDALTAAAPHLTRANVTANNTVTLKSASITAVKAGYYYDLYITINPDYLYVLSEHDNKHLTVQ